MGGPTLFKERDWEEPRAMPSHNVSLNHRSYHQSIYSSKEPWADLVDGGMALKGRYNSEMPIEIQNICPVNLHGLPKILEI